MFSFQNKVKKEETEIEVTLTEEELMAMEVQEVFNEDGIDLLLEEGVEVEHVYEENNKTD